MLNYLENNPSKKLNRILLISGILIFIPVYYLNYVLLSNIINLDTLRTLLTSFNKSQFKEILYAIIQKGQSNDFLFVQIVNFFSTIGFTAVFFSITITIARSVKKDSKLYRVSIFQPLIVLTIALLDILSSLLFLVLIRKPAMISDSTTFFIDSSYIFRMILIYIEFLWIMAAGIFFGIRYIRRRSGITENAGL